MCEVLCFPKVPLCDIKAYLEHGRVVGPRVVELNVTVPGSAQEYVGPVLEAERVDGVEVVQGRGVADPECDLHFLEVPAHDHRGHAP